MYVERKSETQTEIKKVSVHPPHPEIETGFQLSMQYIINKGYVQGKKARF